MSQTTSASLAATCCPMSITPIFDLATTVAVQETYRWNRHSTVSLAFNPQTPLARGSQMNLRNCN
jgi:hypothetical protein